MKTARTMAVGSALVIVGAPLLFWAFRSPSRSKGDAFLYGNGRLEATEVQVSPEWSGRVLESRLVEGAQVTAGDVLVRLDATELDVRIAQLRAEEEAQRQAAARAAEQLGLWRHHAETATRELERFRNLQASGIVAPRQVDSVENEYEEARRQVGALEAQGRESRARVEVASRQGQVLKIQLGKGILQAPITGTVLRKGVEAGEIATPARPVAVLADLRVMELRVFIPEPELGKIRLAAPARAQVDAFPDRTFEARVARIDSRPQFTPREVHVPDQRVRVVFAVILTVDNAAGYLKPGMPADAWIRWREEVAWPDRFRVPD